VRRPVPVRHRPGLWLALILLTASAGAALGLVVTASRATPHHAAPAQAVPMRDGHEGPGGRW
jgi:hypothetical protein